MIYHKIISNLLKYITIDYESPGYIRSYVKIIEDIKEDESFEFLSGLIKITVDYKDLKRQRYEGVISVEQKSITDSFEQYFLQSEQIETKLKIFLMGNSSSALMIQKLPQLNYQDAFKEASLFIDTISLAELTKYQNGHWQELLNKIFIFSNLQIFNISPISYKCRCSKERMIVALKTIPKTDLLLQAQQENGIEVKCEFCNNIINFTIEDISVL
jgi:molecular chaperone Hsp33